MPALLRNRFVWIAVIVLALAGGGSWFVTSQTAAKKAKAAAVTASVKPSPYAAIANGKADVEGGIIQVAARRAKCGADAAASLVRAWVCGRVAGPVRTGARWCA